MDPFGPLDPMQQVLSLQTYEVDGDSLAETIGCATAGCHTNSCNTNTVNTLGCTTSFCTITEKPKLNDFSAS
jgi:hypothetical protein